MRGLAIAIAGWIALTAVGAGVAADDDKAAAKAAFAQGKALFEEGRYAEAAASFRRAYEIKPNWKILYNIGQCEALAKRHGLALQAFESYLSAGGDDLASGRREEILVEVERLRKMVGAIEIEAPDGAVVLVDGVERERAPLPGPMMVAAGVTHQLVIKLGDDVLVDRPVRVSGGQSIAVEAEAQATVEPTESAEAPQPGPSQPETLEAEEDGGKLATAGWVVLGIGGACLIGGAVTGSVALSTDKDLEQDCPGGDCAKDQWDKVDKLNAMAITTDVLIGVGAAAAATGIVLLIVSAVGDGEQGDADVAFVPAVGAGFAGAGLQGRF